MNIAINPGAGPVEDATEQHAVDNMKHLVADCSVEGIRSIRQAEIDEDGRFGFLVWKDGFCHEVEMPGLPLSRVRVVGDELQDAWDFPRLYVDGSSWLWEFAVNIIDRIGLRESPEETIFKAALVLIAKGPCRDPVNVAYEALKCVGINVDNGSAT